jgi:BirA family biotin operon repressor/biotin-[acetyl-CoA-carboxylase] ligase
MELARVNPHPGGIVAFQSVFLYRLFLALPSEEIHILLTRICMELTKEYLLDALPTLVFGQKLFVFEEIDSTNSCTRTLADVGADEGTLVVAEHQTEGRGRLGRSWTAEPRSNLLFSLLLRPPLSQDQAGILPFYAAVAIARAVEPLVDQRVECKWPNDLLLNGKKFCGILLETAIQEGRLAHAILGVGLNVNQRAFPESLAATATSLARERNRGYDRRKLLHSILAEMEVLYTDVRTRTPDTILSEWLSRCAMIGKEVAVQTGDAVVRGRALAVRETGALVLETTDGQEAFFAADVSLSSAPGHPERS